MFLASLKRHKDIIFYRTIAGIKSEGRQRYLGYLWFLLEPALSTAVLYIAFSQFTGRSGPDSILFILIGMILWQWFEGSVMVGASAIKAKFHVLNQFNLPKYIFPLVAIFTNTWKFLCVSVVIFALAAVFGYTPNIYWLWLPVFFALQLALIIGITLPVSIGVTLWNDFQTIVSTIFRLLFFLSGIFFSVSSVPEDLLGWFYANPMAVFMESGRAIILRGEPPPWEHLPLAIAITLVFFALGLVLHARYDKRILKLTNAV
ncbi:MAG: ABC transporter permease [Puniceicoccales bacterium]|jgi:lipopolysaccharide transport system permease protein|nr:ABC transporter permease [Puniceicoccales bacterium]